MPEAGLVRHEDLIRVEGICTAVVKLGRIVLVGATAGDLGGDNALRIRTPD